MTFGNPNFGNVHAKLRTMFDANTCRAEVNIALAELEQHGFTDTNEEFVFIREKLIEMWASGWSCAVTSAFEQEKSET